MQRKASANEFIRTMVAVGTFYLQKVEFLQIPIQHFTEISFTPLALNYSYPCLNQMQLETMPESEESSRFIVGINPDGECCWI